MEEGRGIFDASAYMLFEASGDSEALYIDGVLDLEFDPPPAEDDAQSCSYGSVGGGCCEDEAIVASAPDDCCCGEGEEEGGEDSEEEEDGVVDQCTAVEKVVRSDGWEEANVEAINDREGDRLFWEMCLAS